MNEGILTDRSRKRDKSNIKDCESESHFIIEEPAELVKEPICVW